MEQSLEEAVLIHRDMRTIHAAFLFLTSLILCSAFEARDWIVLLIYPTTATCLRSVSDPEHTALPDELVLRLNVLAFI